MLLFEAVCKACHEIGVQTSLAELLRRVRGLCGKGNLTSVAMFRKKYCEKYGIPVMDCRTYRGQARRNMFSDVQCSWDGIKLIKQICKKLKVTAVELAEKFSMFHSIDQLKLHCRELNSF